LGVVNKKDNFVDEANENMTPYNKSELRSTRIMEQFKKARIFVSRFIEDHGQLIGELVDNRELANQVVLENPETGTTEEILKAKAELQNYIDWLLSQNPWDIHAKNNFLEDAVVSNKMPSKSLLFLLLRHSLLSAQADTLLKILDHEGLINQLTRKKLGQPAYFYNYFRHLQTNPLNYITKWSYLFGKIDYLDGVLGVTMDKQNAFYNYISSQNHPKDYLNHYVSPVGNVFTNSPLKQVHQPYIDELDKTRDAIEALKEIPTKRIEQLMAEHLDLCSYRIDAWQLGLVNKRLTEQRTQNSTGIYLGAYGWVENLQKGGDRAPATQIPSGLWQEGDGALTMRLRQLF